MRLIRILFIVNGFAIGGGELKLLGLIRQLLVNHGDQFQAVLCSVGQGGPLQKEFEQLGIKTVVVHKKGKYDASQIWKVIQLIREERIQVVQTTLFYADIIGTLAARLAGVRNIISWEAITQPYGFKHLMAYRFASKWFERSVAVSEAIQKKVIEERRVAPVKTMTIHYGVDLEKFNPKSGDPIRRKMGFGKGHLILGTVARLTEQKGHCYLLDAVPHIAEAFPAVRFLFIGDGPLRAELENQAKRLDVDSIVFFLGFRSDVQEILNALELFILPSLYEGLPNVVLEAMACGVPVVATAVDGTPEAVIHGETGFLVPSRDSDALADAVIRLLRNPNMIRTMGRNARKRIEKNFTLDAETKKFVELYENLNF